jgi:hypothetical protein
MCGLYVRDDRRSCAHRNDERGIEPTYPSGQRLDLLVMKPSMPIVHTLFLLRHRWLL